MGIILDSNLEFSIFILLLEKKWIFVLILH